MSLEVKCLLQTEHLGLYLFWKHSVAVSVFLGRRVYYGNAIAVFNVLLLS